MIKKECISLGKNPNKDKLGRDLVGLLNLEDMTVTYTDKDEGDLVYDLKKKLQSFDGKEVKISINLAGDSELEPDY